MHERYASVSPAQVVEAIWARWEADLGEWDLEGATANARAHELALSAVEQLLDENPG